jgi:hypothetical protein
LFADRLIKHFAKIEGDAAYGMLCISCHEYIFLIDFILYLCCSGWFHISMEIDFVTHCHLMIFERNIIILMVRTYDDDDDEDV